MSRDELGIDEGRRTSGSSKLDNLLKSIRSFQSYSKQTLCSSTFTLIILTLDLAVIPTYSFYAGTHQYLIFYFKQCRNYFTSFPCVPYQYLESRGTDLPPFPARKVFSSKCLENIGKYLFINAFLELSCIFRARLDVRDVYSCPYNQI